MHYSCFKCKIHTVPYLWDRYVHAQIIVKLKLFSDKVVCGIHHCCANWQNACHYIRQGKMIQYCTSLKIYISSLLLCQRYWYPDITATWHQKMSSVIFGNLKISLTWMGWATIWKKQTNKKTLYPSYFFSVSYKWMYFQCSRRGK